MPVILREKWPFSWFDGVVRRQRPVPSHSKPSRANHEIHETGGTMELGDLPGIKHE
jgi:hypothetical protein